MAESIISHSRSITMDELQNIQSKIHVIRGHRVMLDSDIAGFYGVETKRLNEKVKRNPKRFAGEDFMFQLTQEEYDDLRLRSQIATIKKGRGSHSKYLPHVFTLLGVSMLSSVLESDTAIEANRRIMRAFGASTWNTLNDVSLNTSPGSSNMFTPS